MTPEQFEKAAALQPKLSAIKNRLIDAENMVLNMSGRSKDDHSMSDRDRRLLVPYDLYMAFLFATKAYWEQKLKELEKEMAAI